MENRSFDPSIINKGKIKKSFTRPISKASYCYVKVLKLKLEATLSTMHAAHIPHAIGFLPHEQDTKIPKTTDIAKKWFLPFQGSPSSI